MSRTVPSAIRAAALASQTPEVLCEFLTISHADLADPLRIVNNTAALTRGGYAYAPFPFRVELPVDREGEIGDARLVLCAVDRSMIEAIRLIQTPATVSIALALASNPDGTEMELGDFLFKDIFYNAQTISGSLTYEDRLDIMVPALSFTPKICPGIF